MYILDYPAIRPNELFYSYMLRYHAYSGNFSLGTTNREFTCNSFNLQEVLFPRGLKICLEELHISVDDYINNHSALMYYRMFLPEKRYDKIRTRTLYQKGTHLVNKLRIKKNCSVYYCPVCMREHLSYDSIKVYHQLDSVYVCPKHHCYLNELSLNRQQRIIDLDSWDLSVVPCEKNGILEQIANDVLYIFNNKPMIDNKGIRECLFDAAILRRVFDAQKWNEERCNVWKTFYAELPAEYDEYRSVASFKRYASSKYKEWIDPIEYILFIRSLFGSFEDFVRIYDIKLQI